MAPLSKDRGDREYSKFVADSNDDTCVRTLESKDSAQISGLYKGIPLSNTVSSVPANSETLLLTMTVATLEAYLGQISATGSADGIYKLKVDNTFIAERRTSWCDRNARFEYQFLKLNAGQVVQLTVTHKEAVAQEYSADMIFIEVAS